MIGSQFSSLFTNPKFLGKAAYLSFLVFGAFHMSKFIFTMGATLMLRRFGKPTLVRETSKIFTNNYLMIPFMWTRKFV